MRISSIPLSGADQSPILGEEIEIAWHGTAYGVASHQNLEKIIPQHIGFTGDISR
jgi:hypothetical protein